MIAKLACFPGFQGVNAYTLGYSARDASGIRSVKGPTGAAALIVRTQLACMSRLQNHFATQAQTPTV